VEWVYVSNFFGLGVVNANFICLEGFFTHELSCGIVLGVVGCGLVGFF
jgi:hypothetical protein